MAMIEFVRNYTDHSTDRGYQFQFNCDHCGNGYMSSYQTSMIGTAGGLLQAAGSIFGGLLSNVGNSSYQIQRVVGGPAHDHALQQAVAEVKQKFRQCQRCGNWVCAEICWNERAAQCTGCNPKYEQEVISARTRAQVNATQQQLQLKADGTDYVSGIDMNPDAQVQFSPVSATPPVTTAQMAAPSAPVPSGHFLPASWQTVLPSSPQATPLPPAAASCQSCGATLAGGKFCSSCGERVVALPRTCSACGHVAEPAARFCEECGGKLA